MNHITGNTYRTYDYSKFKKLDGNREVTNARARKIRVSIEKNGYIFNPIVVNEFMEVIDGQGRLEALRTLELPVDYVIAEGTGLKQCIALNSSGTIWTLADYIESYCELENENYIRLRNIIKDFPEIRQAAKIMAATGSATINNEAIRNGRIVVTEEMEEDARHNLKFLSRFNSVLSRVKGDPRYYCYAIMFANRVGADKERLIDTAERNPLPPVVNQRQALDAISDIYNKNLKDAKKKIYLFEVYEKTMCEKYGWYGAKWGGRQ